MNEPINVLFYSEKWTSGGIEALVMNIFRNLDKNIIKANILTSQDETNIYDEEIGRLGGKKYVTLEEKYKSPIIRTLRNFRSLKRKIKELNCDVLHLNICHGVAMVYAYLAKKAGVKYVIIHSHNSNVGEKNRTIKNIGHIVCKHLFEKYGDKYLACSDLAAKWLYTKKTNENGKVILINNAIDSKKFTFNVKEREKTRKNLNIENKFVIGHIGRFNEQKNHKYLIEIFKEIHDIKKDCVLLLIGEGELKQEIIEKVKNYNLLDNVIFYGETTEIPKMLWAMDVFVLPSLFEGKPVVGIEVQAASLKSFLSDTITKTVKLSDYIEYLNKNESPKKWADEILRQDKGYERKDMNKIIEDNGYDIKEVTKQLQDIYVEALKGE